MIFTQTPYSPVVAAKQIFMHLYNEGSRNTSDKSIWLEDAAVIEIKNPEGNDSKGFIVEQGRFRYIGDYKLRAYILDRPTLIL
jgi:hypothetical protein